jgi:hypothetical protein
MSPTSHLGTVRLYTIHPTSRSHTYRCIESHKGNRNKLENNEMFTEGENRRLSDRDYQAQRRCTTQSVLRAY